MNERTWLYSRRHILRGMGAGVKGESRNQRDGIFRSIRDPKARQAVLADFGPAKGSRIGELAAHFDIVLGFTPEV